MEATSKFRPPLLRADRPLLRLRGRFLSVNADLPPVVGSEFKYSRVLLTFQIRCKFTTFCDRKGYTMRGTDNVTRYIFSQEQEDSPTTTSRSQPTEQWMLICQQSVDLQPSMDTQEDIDWTLAAQSYPNL